MANLRFDSGSLQSAAITRSRFVSFTRNPTERMMWVSRLWSASQPSWVVASAHSTYKSLLPCVSFGDRTILSRYPPLFGMLRSTSFRLLRAFSSAGTALASPIRRWLNQPKRSGYGLQESHPQPNRLMLLEEGGYRSLLRNVRLNRPDGRAKCNDSGNNR